MLLIIPIFAGLLACMPVPIGDPERSKIDPDLTGIWVMLGDDDDVDAGFYVFEPYDKRTWLLAAIGIEAGENVDLDKYDFSTYQGYESLAMNEKVSFDDIYADGIGLQKAWLTKLGGEQFFTWEPMGKVDALADVPEYWMVFHLAKENENTLVLRMVDSASDPFEDIKETRRAYERVLKKHARNPEIFGDDDLSVTLVRAEGPLLGFLEDVADLVFEE